MGQRRKARELAFQILYSHQQSEKSLSELVSEIENVKGLSEEGRRFAGELITLTISNLSKIDEMIQSCSINWDVARILPIDMGIMRVAVNELIHKTAPPAVVINEAIEISKRFGTENSGNFINGILDCVRKKIESADA